MLDLEESRAVGRREQVPRDGNVESELGNEPTWLNPIDEAMGGRPKPTRTILNITGVSCKMKLSSQPEELVFFRRWDRNPAADLFHAVVTGDGKALARAL